MDEIYNIRLFDYLSPNAEKTIRENSALNQALGHIDAYALKCLWWPWLGWTSPWPAIGEFCKVKKFTKSKMSVAAGRLKILVKYVRGFGPVLRWILVSATTLVSVIEFIQSLNHLIRFK